jgi:predicted RNA binding protein YcfA (HicA-like mRNA interferase family)
MPAFSARQTRGSLLKKGFSQLEGDHHQYVFIHGGKIVTRTKMSHNDQEINNSLISKMHKQCQISKKDFIGLVDCSVSGEDYATLLKEQGLIP